VYQGEILGSLFCQSKRGKTKGETKNASGKKIQILSTWACPFFLEIRPPEGDSIKRERKGKNLKLLRKCRNKENPKTIHASGKREGGKERILGIPNTKRLNWG